MRCCARRLRAGRHGRVSHDLSHAQGHADLKVDGLTFDKDFQPAQLTSWRWA
jgi:hypothetical protein